MKSLLSFSFLTLFSLTLHAQLTAPKLGTVRYSDGSLHSVQGLHNNLIVCDLSFDAADAASFSDQGGLVSQQGVIRLLGPDLSVIFEYKSGETAPLLNIESDLTSALAWLPDSHVLLHWDGQHFAEFRLADSDLEGTVTSLQSLNSKQARLLVTHSDGSVSSLTFSTRNGSLVSSESVIGVRGYAFSQSFFVVYSNPNQLIADNLRGYRRSVAMPATDVLIERMSNSWLHLYSPTLKRDWALHLTQGDLELSLLPAVAAPKPTSTVAAANTSTEPK